MIAELDTLFDSDDVPLVDRSSLVSVTRRRNLTLSKACFRKLDCEDQSANGTMIL